MIFERQPDHKQNILSLKTFEGKKLNWKDKFKRELFRQNLKLIELNKSKKKKDLKEEQQKRAAAKVLSKLFEKKTIYIVDNQDSFAHHNHYSSFIPLSQQVKLKDEFQSTFPYIQYLIEKFHSQAKSNIYNQISNCLKHSVENNCVQIGWRSCLKKYMCSIDTLKAMEIYVQLLKKGTSILEMLYKKYGNQCSPVVFFHRVCQSAKYFKESNKINKNIQSSIEVSDQISEVSLPKTSKFLFCSICLLYDCNQHNMDDTVTDYNYQYVARDNIISQQTHIYNVLKLIKFQRMLNISDDQSNKIDIQEGQEEVVYNQCEMCSPSCYMRLNKDTYKKKSSTRRPIISLIHRSLINMAIDIFSYDPCLISMWVGRQSQKTKRQTGLAQQANRGISCQNVLFYFIQEYDLVQKLHNNLYKSEVDYLMNQSSRPKNEANTSSSLPNKKKKNKPRFDHGNNQNYRIGCCFHYFIGQQVIDHNCQRCCCKKRGFCLPQCQCPSTCPIRKVGCSCKGKQDCRTKKCPCFSNNQECIPGLCKGCFDTQMIKNKKNTCRNSLILKQQTKYIKIGDSNICGLGAFAGEDINKEDLVICYTGQIIEHQIDYSRQALRVDDTFYNFGNYEGGAIDARFMGNKARFINHSKGAQENLQAVSMFSEGRFKTVLYAKKNIKKGEELFFDYDVEGNISKNFPGKYPFIK